MQDIVHTFHTPASPSTVLEAAATQAGIRTWWCTRAEMAKAPGGHHTLRFTKNGEPVVMEFDYTHRDPNSVRWLCTANDNPAWVGSTLEWQAQAADEGSRVTFTHRDFASGGPPYEGTKQGWPKFMASLEAHLRGDSADPL